MASDAEYEAAMKREEERKKKKKKKVKKKPKPTKPGLREAMKNRHQMLNSY